MAANRLVLSVVLVQDIKWQHGKKTKTLGL